MSAKRQTLNFSQYVPNNKVLDKKVPENPRYKHVRAAVNSGKNIRRYIDTLKEQQKNANLRKDEVFKRIKISAFVRLAVAVFSELFIADSARVDSDGICQDNSNLQNVNENKPAKEFIPPTAFCSVLMGIGELDLQNERRKQTTVIKVKPEKELPYLLLDVRDRDEYLQCHIITARNYPSAMLSRSLGYETRDLQLYKNVPSELIILYDDDEATAARVAKTLVERGYENVFLLSGGLKLAIEKFPHGLINDSCHVDSLPETGDNFGMTVASPKRYVQKMKFTPEDISLLQEYLDHHFCPNKESDLLRSSGRSCLSSSKEQPSSFGAFKRTDQSTGNQSLAKGSSISFKSSNVESAPNSRSGTPISMHHKRPTQMVKKPATKPKNPPWK